MLGFCYSCRAHPTWKGKWPGLSCTWCLPLAHKHPTVSFGDLIFMAWTTGHPSQSDLVWEGWKYDSLSKYHLRVSKSYNNVDSITLENQGGRITWKQNTQTGPKGRPSTTKDNFLRDSDPRAHSSEAALKHSGKTSKEREKIHNAFLKQLCSWSRCSSAWSTALSFVWTPTCFLPCDLLFKLRRCFWDFFFFPPSGREEGKHLSSVFWFCFCYVGSAAARSRLFPGNCSDFAGQHSSVTIAFPTKLEMFSKCSALNPDGW